MVSTGRMCQLPNEGRRRVYRDKNGRKYVILNKKKVFISITSSRGCTFIGRKSRKQ